MRELLGWSQRRRRERRGVSVGGGGGVPAGEEGSLRGVCAAESAAHVPRPFSLHPPEIDQTAQCLGRKAT